MKEAKQLLKFSDVADQLKVSVRTVHRMVADGLPYIHLVGSVKRVDQVDLDRFIKKHTKVLGSPDISGLISVRRKIRSSKSVRTNKI